MILSKRGVLMLVAFLSGYSFMRFAFIEGEYISQTLYTITFGYGIITIASVIFPEDSGEKSIVIEYLHEALLYFPLIIYGFVVFEMGQQSLEEFRTIFNNQNTLNGFSLIKQVGWELRLGFLGIPLGIAAYTAALFLINLAHQTSDENDD